MLEGQENRALNIKAETAWDYSSFHVGDWPSKGYSLCDGKPREDVPNNQFQSPINLQVAASGKKWNQVSTRLELYAERGGCEGGKMFVDGHTFEVSFGDCTNLKARWKNTTYTLKQFHFHAESENLLNGMHTPAELHMVHKSEDGRALVIAVFIVRPRISSVTQNKLVRDVLTKGLVKGRYVLETINPYRALLTAGSRFYSFLGSLTTPPCIPNISWLVMKETVSVSDEVLDPFLDYLATSPSIGSSYFTNSRPPQPLNGRVIEKGNVCGSSLFGAKSSTCTGLMSK